MTSYMHYVYLSAFCEKFSRQKILLANVLVHDSEDERLIIPYKKMTFSVNALHTWSEILEENFHNLNSATWKV